MLALAVNLACLVVDAWLLRRERPWWGVVLLPAVAVLVGVPLRSTGPAVFAVMQCLAWAGFLHLPLVLMLGGHRAVGGALAALGLWAFGVEPRWLEVTRVPLAGPGLRVALIADIQTDHVDAHTRRAIQAVADADPDLVLFAGDYLQVRDDDAFTREAASLNEALRVLHPRLGAIAVEGDVDHPRWAEIFAGLPVRVVTETTTLYLGDLVVTALDPEASRRPRARLPEVTPFHLVFGHAPDYALLAPPGDLLLAGHTHGGQVRLPGYGPLLTFSAVPRDWAAGLSRLSDGRPLYVSRGVGMERYDAPRLRFACRPEVTLLDLGDRSAPGRFAAVPTRGGAPDDAQAPIPGPVADRCRAALGAEVRARVEDVTTLRFDGSERRAGLVSCAPPGSGWDGDEVGAGALQLAWITGTDGKADFVAEVGHRREDDRDWWTDPGLEPVDVDGDGDAELMISGRWERTAEIGTLDADLARVVLFPTAATPTPDPCPWSRLLPDRLPHALYVVDEGRVRDEPTGAEGTLRMALGRDGDRLRITERWVGPSGWAREHVREARWDPATRRLVERCPTDAPPLAR